MSVQNMIRKEWLESPVLKYHDKLYGIAINRFLYGKLVEELRAIQHMPPSEESLAIGFDLGIKMLLPGTNDYAQVYPCDYQFEGVHFIV